MVEVHFATNRNFATPGADYFGERFNPEGPMFFRVGRAELEKISDDADNGYDVKNVEVFPEKASDVKVAVDELVGSSKFFGDMQDRISADPRDVIVLIHGFACTFVDGLKRAAQIKEAYLIQGKDDAAAPYEPYVVVFSWPSNGRVFPPWEYHSDRQDAAASGVAMARFVMRLRKFLTGNKEDCKQRIHLVAHSMGNWALRSAVRELAYLVEQARFPTIFTNAFLMAADEDEDTFESDHKMMRLLELARSIHVYHSRGDLALIGSDATKFNPERLGSGGPKSFSGLSNRIVAIDCMKVDQTTNPLHLNHQYYRLRPEVIGDVQAVLSGRFLPDQIPFRKVVESGRRYRIPNAEEQAGEAAKQPK